MEEERDSKSMCQTCPYMQQPPCMMQGMYMNPSMMYPQQMQQPMGYNAMMGEMNQSMGNPTERDDEDFLERAYGHGHGGGHYGHGHYGHYYPNYYYGGFPSYPYPYYPYYPYPTLY